MVIGAGWGSQELQDLIGETIFSEKEERSWHRLTPTGWKLRLMRCSQSFFPLIAFGGTEVNFFIYSSAAPQRTAYSAVTVLSQKAAHLRIENPLFDEEVAGFEPGTAGLQSGVATNEPPLLSKPPPLP